MSCGLCDQAKAVNGAIAFFLLSAPPRRPQGLRDANTCLGNFCCLAFWRHAWCRSLKIETLACPSCEGVNVTEVKYWLKGEARQNFGDYLSEFLMQSLFYDLRPDDIEVRLIGSCIHDSFVPGGYDPAGIDPEPTAIFWGCGVRDKGGLSAESRKRADIRAVRGPVSASELRLGLDVAMGDPALMMPALYTPEKRPSFIGRSVCIPHFHDDRSDEAILQATGADIVLRPNIPYGINHLLSFIDALTSADFVLTASLHGAIIAAAYGTGFAYWRAETIDLPLKWDDFSRSISIETTFVDHVEEGRRVYVDATSQQLTLPSTLPLLAVAPFPLKASGLIAVLQYELGRVTPDEYASVLGDFASALGRHQHDIDQLMAEAAAILDLHHGEEGSLQQFRQVIDQIADLGVKSLGVTVEDEPSSPESKLAAILAEAQKQRAKLERQAAYLDSMFRMTADGEMRDLPLEDEFTRHVARVKQLIQEHLQLQLSLNKLEGELSLSRTEAETLRAQIHADAQAADARLSDSVKMQEALDQQIADLQQFLDAAAAEQRELAERVADLDARHNDMQRENESLLEEIAGLNWQVEQATRDQEAWELEREAAAARQLDTDWQAKAASYRQRQSNRALVRHLIATQAQNRIDALAEETEALSRDAASPGPRMFRRVIARSGAAASVLEGKALQASQSILGSGLFDSGWYERQLGGTVHSDALQHYLTVGGHEGASPHLLFDPAHYASQAGDMSLGSTRGPDALVA